MIKHGFLICKNDDAIYLNISSYKLFGQPRRNLERFLAKRADDRTKDNPNSPILERK